MFRNPRALFILGMMVVAYVYKQLKDENHPNYTAGKNKSSDKESFTNKSLNKLSTFSKRFVVELSKAMNFSPETTFGLLMRNPNDVEQNLDSLNSFIQNGTFTHLNLYGKFTSGNLRKIPNLELLNKLEYLAIGKNNFSELDFSENPFLKVLDIENMEGETDINISNNHELEKLLGFDSNSKATIYCRQSQKDSLFDPQDTKVIAYPDNPLARHALCEVYNWDAGISLLKYILRSEDTDKATALMIYWMGKPQYFTQFKTIVEVPDHALENYFLCKEIERKITKGFYKENNIDFDPKNFRGKDWTNSATPSESLSSIPAEMFG